MKSLVTKSGTIPFLPLLAVYSLFVLAASDGSIAGDGARYIMYARNLLKGFYAPPDTLLLWNGPGYPLVLMPFVYLNLPFLLAKFLNAFFLFAAVVYVYHSLMLYLNQRKRAVCYAYVMGIYLLLCGSQIQLLMTEPLSAFCLSGFIFHFCRTIKSGDLPWPHFLISAGFLAYLALTKVFFGYVITLMLIATAILLLITRVKRIKQSALIFFLSIVFCSPYLVYTYNLTGKAFYWGNSGGMQFYWMTVHEPGFLGDWIHENTVLQNPLLFKNHIDLYRLLEKTDYVAWDSETKKRGLENLKQNPRKYLLNWRANVNRMILDFPYSQYPGSHSELKTGNRSLLSFLIYFLFGTALVFLFRGYGEIPLEIWLTGCFIIVSLGGLSLLSAFFRFVVPLIPVMGFWSVIVLQRTCRTSQSSRE
ncbi:hypothetical protein ACFL5V_04685 [Fibrobacterota bacterium]